MLLYANVFIIDVFLFVTFTTSSSLSYINLKQFWNVDIPLFVASWLLLIHIISENIMLSLSCVELLKNVCCNRMRGGGYVLVVKFSGGGGGGDYVLVVKFTGGIMS